VDTTLSEIFIEMLKLDVDELTDELSADSVDTWDSLAHLTIVTAIEQEFGIQLSMDEIQSAATVGDFRWILAKHTSER